MNLWTLGAIAIAGGLFGMLVANVVITLSHLGDMEDVWGDDEDL